MNYFLGIDARAASARRRLRGGTGRTVGLNHPVIGTTAITTNVWHHAAATYDGTTWSLYLDGVLDGTLTSACRPPRVRQHPARGLGTAMTSTGVGRWLLRRRHRRGRIWNVARSQAEIQAAMNTEITVRHRPARPLGPQRGHRHDRRQLRRPAAQRHAHERPDLGPARPTPPRPPLRPASTPPPATALVTLAWTANTEPDLAGYNVYRITTSPVPSRAPRSTARSSRRRPTLDSDRRQRHDRTTTPSPRCDAIGQRVLAVGRGRRRRRDRHRRLGPAASTARTTT